MSKFHPGDLVYVKCLRRVYAIADVGVDLDKGKSCYRFTGLYSTYYDDDLELTSGGTFQENEVMTMDLSDIKPKILREAKKAADTEREKQELEFAKKEYIRITEAMKKLDAHIISLHEQYEKLATDLSLYQK